MPIYEYQCNRCGEVFEAFQKINDNPLSECKFCHSGVERLISQTSFQLKGSGWYLTDYSRKSTPSAAAGESGASSSDKSEKSGDTGTKAAEKSEKSKDSSSSKS